MVIVLLENPLCAALVFEILGAFRQQCLPQPLLVLTLGDVPGRLALQVVVLGLLLASASYKVLVIPNLVIPNLVMPTYTFTAMGLFTLFTLGMLPFSTK
jgi:hypothetical protein